MVIKPWGGRASAIAADSFRQAISYQRRVKGDIDVHLEIALEPLRKGGDIFVLIDLGGFCIDAKDAVLHDGLGGASADQPLWAVRTNNGERGMRIVRLNHRGQRIGHGRAGGHHHPDVAVLHARHA